MTDTSFGLLDRLRHEPNSSCWRRLSLVYEPLIRSWLGRHALPIDDSDDLVQEVLMVVVKKLPDYEHNHRRGAFRNWLRRITANCLLDFWKSKRLRPLASGGNGFQQVVLELEDHTTDLARQWDRQHDQHITRVILRQIKSDFEPKTWRAFEMLTLEQMAPSDVAAELEMTTNAVYAAKSRVMTRLRQEAHGLVD